MTYGAVMARRRRRDRKEIAECRALWERDLRVCANLLRELGESRTASTWERTQSLRDGCGVSRQMTRYAWNLIRAAVRREVADR